MAAKPKGGNHNALIRELVAYFVEHRSDFDGLLDNVRALLLHDKNLMANVHSLKFRIKSPESLRDKLERKSEEARKDQKEFPYTRDNLFLRVNDLVGFRILHLHTNQMKDIDEALKERLREAAIYKIIEGPLARTWDDEARTYFRSVGIQTKKSPTMYTSVHYVVKSMTQNKFTFEIQVRTLAEELWGEVDHTINYPHPSDSASCRDQLAVLARMTSSCSRLVDSIFRSHREHAASLPIRRKTVGKPAR